MVIAAIVGLLGGGIRVRVSSEDAQRRHAAELDAKQREAVCDRAFAFLQDDKLHPKLESDDGFYQTQRQIADRCSAKGNN